jgi:hypothetical protein
MRCALPAAACLLLAASLASAGGVPDTDDGSQQWIFEFNGLGDLGLDTYAGGFGMRLFLDDQGLAGRGSFNAAYRTDEENGDKSTFSLIGGSIIIEKFLEPVSSVSPYAGIGFGYFYSKNKQPTAEGDFEVTSNILEVPAVVGFQWYFTEAVGIGGEYRLALRYITEEGTLSGYGIGESTKLETGIYAASIFLTLHR